LGVERLTSLRDGIGEIDPALIFSFRGLGVSDLFSLFEEAGSTVFEDPVERLSAKGPRVAETNLPRVLGVLSTLETPLREGQELSRRLFTDLLIMGPLNIC
jgi:hypothetical protein